MKAEFEGSQALVAKHAALVKGLASRDVQLGAQLRERAAALEAKSRELACLEARPLRHACSVPRQFDPLPHACDAPTGAVRRLLAAVRESPVALLPRRQGPLSVPARLLLLASA